MSVQWSPQQREWLQAMGYRVLALAADAPWPAEPRDAVPAEPRAEAPTRPPPPRRPPPAAAPVAVAERPSRPSADRPRPRAAEAGSPLYRALLRATGQRTTRAAEAMLAQLDPDLAALRGDAAAKRALWPRLRALRRDAPRR